VSGRPRLRTFGWPASAAVALALVVPGGAAAAATGAAVKTETATNGTITAELSYVTRRRGSGRFRFTEFRNFYLRALKRFLGRTGYLG
jgi:hypothetical protein